MQLTAQDKRAARDGFAYVVVRGGQRVCYTTTLGEAKRECGKSGKVVSISGMRYTAKNPSGKTFGDLSVGESFDFVSGTSYDSFYDRCVKTGSRTYTPIEGNLKGKTLRVGSVKAKVYHVGMRNPSSGAKQRARGTRSYGKGLFVEADLSGRHARMLDKAAGIRRKSAKLGPTYTKLMHRDALAEAARVRNPAKQQWYLIDKYGEALVGVGKFSSREAARKKANNMVARDVELTGMLLVSYNDLHGLGHFVDPTSVTLYSRKRRNPASKADTVALALAKVDKRAGQVTGEDNSIEARAKRLRKSGYVVSGDPYGYGFPQQPKSIKAATILTEFKGGKVAPPSSSYSWSFDLNRELGNKAWEVYPVNSVATLIFKW